VNDANGDSAVAVNANGNSRTVRQLLRTHKHNACLRALLFPHASCCAANAQVLAPILASVPLGTSCVTFEVAVFEESLAAGPLKLKARRLISSFAADGCDAFCQALTWHVCAQGFKATPSLSAVEERFKAFDACELDATATGCDNAL
jgi:hypothetical protein